MTLNVNFWQENIPLKYSAGNISKKQKRATRALRIALYKNKTPGAAPHPAR
jgi:hypothetical protein